MTWRFWKTDASGLGLMLALVCGAYFAGFRPLLTSWSTKGDLESRLGSQLAARESAAADHARFESQLRDLMRQIDALEVTLQPRSRVNQRIDDLTGLALTHRIIVDSAIKAGEKDEQLFGVVQIKIRARGSYRALAEFLQSLHFGYRDISVRSFEIEGEQSRDLHARITVDLDWYVIPENRSKSR